MGLDIRTPLGLLFAVIGILLLTYGEVTKGAPNVFRITGSQPQPALRSSYDFLRRGASNRRPPSLWQADRVRSLLY